MKIRIDAFLLFADLGCHLDDVLFYTSNEAASITNAPIPSIPTHHSSQFALLASSFPSSSFSLSNLTIFPPALIPNTLSPLPLLHPAASVPSQSFLCAGSGASKNPSTNTHVPAGSVETNSPMTRNVSASLIPPLATSSPLYCGINIPSPRLFKYPFVIRRAIGKAVGEVTVEIAYAGIHRAAHDLSHSVNTASNRECIWEGVGDDVPTSCPTTTRRNHCMVFRPAGCAGACI
jgi:hypothetical protein